MNGAQADSAKAARTGRYGVEVNTVVEEKDSVPEKRMIRFRFKAKGFSFWASAQKTEAEGIKVTWPWPKQARVEDATEKADIERQVVTKLDAALAVFDEAKA